VAKGASKVKVEVRDPEDVAMAVAMSCTCWHCGKERHVKAFCKEKPLCAKDSVNMAISVNTDSDGVW
jgi:uncharacterized protein (DUF983 family)